MRRFLLILAIAVVGLAQIPSITTAPGGGGTGTAPYSCTVAAVSSIACTHNLATTTPWVSCYDGSGHMLGGLDASTSVTSIDGTSANVATITFSGSTTGTCLISTGSMGPKGSTGSTGATGATGTPVSFGATFLGGGSALTSGTIAGVSLVYLSPLPFACTTAAWSITVDTGTVGFRVWRRAAGTAVPTVADTITTADLAIASGTNLTSTTFTNFSGGIAPVFALGDIVAVQVNSASGATSASFALRCQ